jgi:hypothetical protein
MTRKSSCFPSIQHTSLHIFNRLSIEDKIRLVRNQFGIVNNINEGIIHSNVTTNLIVSLSNVFAVHLAKMH